MYHHTSTTTTRTALTTTITTSYPPALYQWDALSAWQTWHRQQKETVCSLLEVAASVGWTCQSEKGSCHSATQALLFVPMTKKVCGISREDNWDMCVPACLTVSHRFACDFCSWSSHPPNSCSLAVPKSDICCNPRTMSGSCPGATSTSAFRRKHFLLSGSKLSKSTQHTEEFASSAACYCLCIFCLILSLECGLFVQLEQW